MFGALGFILLFSVFVSDEIVGEKLEQVIVGEGDDEVVIDGSKIVSDGKLLVTKVQESKCPGVMEEVELWELITVEDEEEVSNRVELVKTVDITQDTRQVTNRREPWIRGSVIIRYSFSYKTK